MAVDDEARLLYVAIPNANAIGVVDLDELEAIALIPVGECPYAVALDVERGIGASSNQVDASITFFDLAAVAASLDR